MPSGGPAAAARPKGARRTTPSPETLQALGADRLIGLILGETARNPAFRKLVSAALAALQGPDAVAAIVDRRLAALEGARGYIDWQKRRAFTADLDATVSVILSELRPLDPGAALDRLMRFLASADGVLNRVDDSTGATQGVYERASDAAVDIAATLAPADSERFAVGLTPRFTADPFGPFGMLLRDLIPRLPVTALDSLDADLATAAEAVPRPKGPRGDAAWRQDLHRTPLLRARQDIAERRGDIDGFIALEMRIMPERPDRTAIAERLLAAGRPAEALDWVRRPQGKSGIRVVTREELAGGLADLDAPERAQTALEVRILDALGHGPEAQRLRWARFEKSLDAWMLRDFLARLPDFEDEDALVRALDHAAEHHDPYRALAFLIGWPDLERAAGLVLSHRADWKGERYPVLVPAAEALEATHPPAATLLYRCLLDDILGQGRSNAYAHGARYLLTLDDLAERLQPGSLEPDPHAYREGLRKTHGRKSAFWSLLRP